MGAWTSRGPCVNIAYWFQIATHACNHSFVGIPIIIKMFKPNEFTNILKEQENNNHIIKILNLCKLVTSYNFL